MIEIMKKAKDRNKLCFLYDIENKEDEILYCQSFPENISEYRSLNISMLAMDFPDKTTKTERKELEQQWIEDLPKLDHITALSIRHIVNQEFFEAICKMKNLKTLFFWSSRVEDISSIKKLSKLSSLCLCGFSRLKDISPLRKLRSLRRLTIECSFKIENYEIVGELTDLTGLCLGGDTFAPKRLMLESLRPYKNLKNLLHLHMSDASIRDKSYEIILELKSLRRLDAHWRMPDKRRQTIKENHPNLEAGFFVDYNFIKNEFYEGKDW